MVSIEWVLISFCSTHDINFLITSKFVLSVDRHINELSGYNSPTMIVCSLRWFLLPVPACDLSPHGSSVNHLIPPLPDNEQIVWCTSIFNVWNSHQLPAHCYLSLLLSQHHLTRYFFENFLKNKFQLRYLGISPSTNKAKHAHTHNIKINLQYLWIYSPNCSAGANFLECCCHTFSLQSKRGHKVHLGFMVIV